MTFFRRVGQVFTTLFFLPLCNSQFLPSFKEDIVIGASATTPNLDVKIVNEQGFGCKSNAYSWSMESFKDYVYVGTNNNRGGVFGLRFFVSGLPLRVLTAGGQIHRGKLDATTGDWTWEEVVRDGLGDKTNYGIRKMKAAGDHLYAVTGNHNLGMEVWETSNGKDWKVVSKHGFGKGWNTSGRGLAAFKGYIYAGTENRFQGAEIWRRKIDENGGLVSDDNDDWEQVVEKGFDHSRNIWFSDFEVHDDGTDTFLYAGTFNRFGATLWRTADGTNWENVFKEGGGNVNDEAVMRMITYEDRLYIGTSNINDGAALLVSTNQTATEFKPVLSNGMNDTSKHFVWYITPYEGRLYVSFLTSGLNNEFSLYSSDTPELGDFVTETENSFGIANDTIGIRSMAVHDGHLLMGTASGTVPAVVFAGSSKANTTANVLDSV